MARLILSEFEIIDFLSLSNLLIPLSNISWNFLVSIFARSSLFYYGYFYASLDPPLKLDLIGAATIAPGFPLCISTLTYGLSVISSLLFAGWLNEFRVDGVSLTKDDLTLVYD